MNPFKQLWCEVLLQQVQDALYGARGSDIPKQYRAAHTRQARVYLTTPSRDFTNVCWLVGIDPEAARERLKAAIAKAPTPEELAENPLPLPEANTHERPKGRGPRKRITLPGVVSDFLTSEGTGGGTTAQERTKITFPTETGQ